MGADRTLGGFVIKASSKKNKKLSATSEPLRQYQAGDLSALILKRLLMIYEERAERSKTNMCFTEIRILKLALLLVPLPKIDLDEFYKQFTTSELQSEPMNRKLDRDLRNINRPPPPQRFVSMSRINVISTQELKDLEIARYILSELWAIYDLGGESMGRTMECGLLEAVMMYLMPLPKRVSFEQLRAQGINLDNCEAEIKRRLSARPNE